MSPHRDPRKRGSHHPGSRPRFARCSGGETRYTGVPRGGAPDSTSTLRLNQLSPARKRLVLQMHDLGFGRIEHLVIRSGDPVFDPPPNIIETVKLDGDECPAVVPASDFVLKQQVIRLFRDFDRRPNGLVLALSVQHGLPTRVTWGDSGEPPRVPAVLRKGGA